MYCAILTHELRALTMTCHTQGLDTHYPVTLNFGAKPFVFDLCSFENSLLGETASPEGPVDSPMCEPNDTWPVEHQTTWRNYDAILRSKTTTCALPSFREGRPYADVSCVTIANSTAPLSMFSNRALLRRALRLIDSEVYRCPVGKERMIVLYIFCLMLFLFLQERFLAESSSEEYV